MIDWVRAKHLHDEVGGEDFADIVDMFLSEADSTLVRLAEADDPAGIEELLHDLKGGALTMGFARLAAICQHGESACAAGTPDQVDPATVHRAFRDARQVFIREWPGRLADPVEPGGA